MELKDRSLFYGDNLTVLREKIPNEVVDLCYIDPPFNSNRAYFQIYQGDGDEKDAAQSQAFVDTWRWGELAEKYYEEIVTDNGHYSSDTQALINGFSQVWKKTGLMAYIVAMTTRINEIWHKLKPTGSFYLHCDPTASHALKLVCDTIFVAKDRGGNFLNEIVWSYRTGGVGKRWFPRKHDLIFLYTKTKNYHFVPSQETIYYDKPFFTSSEPNKEGKYEVSVRVRDVWEDIKPIINVSKERLGYPTQKPQALLERIIKTSSNKNDLVMDCFCGCGTTVAAAEKLRRRWVGMDITYYSISLMKKRVEEVADKKLEVYLDGIPKDEASAWALANKEDDRLRKEFEKWTILTFTNALARINEQKGADRGIDGRLKFGDFGNNQEGKVVVREAVFQVKSSKNKIGRKDVAQFVTDLQSDGASVGYFIAFNFTRDAESEASRAGLVKLMNGHRPMVKLVWVKDLLGDKGVRCDLPNQYSSHKKAARQSQQGSTQRQ